MRDAFGGTFMIMVFLVFIMVYICFTAVALNYAKAFKVKNAVIDFLEEWEITDLNNIPAEKMEEFRNFIQSIKPSDFEKLLKDDKQSDQ